MPYHKFTIPKVKAELNISVVEKDLFSTIAEYPLEESFVQQVNKGVRLARAIGTEKAKSEFIVALILLELKDLFYEKISIFSGIELNVDKSKGLNGVCDFIISKDSQQFTLDAPIITIVEAKNDNIGLGLGQCMAEMYAAQLYNQAEKNEITAVYGIVTTGQEWQFLKLQESTIIIDNQEYFIGNLPKIFGILVHILTKN